MLGKTTIILALFVSITFFANDICLGTDFDDGISIDDNISDSLSSPTQNLRFIIRNAKRKANVSESRSWRKTNEKSGSLNSVVVGPGSDVNGDIIIIDESKGDKTLVVD